MMTTTGKPKPEQKPVVRKPDLSNFSSRRGTKEINPELKELLATGEIKQVDLYLVDRDENQPRPEDEVLQGIEKFADELELDNFELIQHPVYSIEPNGRYKIVVGERRTAAFKLKGREKITAVCKSFTDEEKEKIFIMQYVENDGELKKPLSPFADAKWWKNYIDNFHGGNLTAACKARGKDKADISNRLTLLSAPEYIQNAVKEMGIADPSTFAGLVRLDARAGESVVKGILADNVENKLGMSLRTYVQKTAKNVGELGDLNKKDTPEKIESTVVSIVPSESSSTINGVAESTGSGKVENSNRIEGQGVATPKANKAVETKIEQDLAAVIKSLSKARFNVRLLESSKANAKAELTDHLTQARDNLDSILNEIKLNDGKE